MADSVGRTTFDEDFRRAAAGDESAIATLWRKHQPLLLRWLRSLDPAVAEDVASDAWIDILRRSEQYEGDEDHFRALLFTIARRRLIDLRRRRTRSPEMVKAVLPEPHGSGDESSVETAALRSDESARAVGTIVRSMSPAQAEVVLLRVIGGLSAEQASQVLGKSPEAVRILQHRGLRKLAETTGHRVSEDEPISSSKA